MSASDSLCTPLPVSYGGRGRNYWRLRGEDDRLYPPLSLTFEGDMAVHSTRAGLASCDYAKPLIVFRTAPGATRETVQ